MAANTSLNLIDLDFDSQKADLKSFLRTQDVFRDYDFEGSNINALLDVLTHNTLKNIFFLNMAISEGFIDSAQLRNTVFSHAKELNYLPRSARSSKANVTISFTADGSRQPYIIQKGQSFSSLIKNQSYVFSIPETITCASADQNFSFTTDIYEGIYVKDSYIYNNTGVIHPSFKISNPNIDISSLVVTVYEDQNIVGDTYLYTTSLLGLNQFSKVFFIQTNVADGKYEVIFGDGIAGRAPKNNAIIILDYRLSNGRLGNGASTFSINFDPTGDPSDLTSTPLVVTTQNSIGGDQQESIESVRFYAPRYFQVQERAVTASDYSILLQVAFPEIDAVNVYGGEQLIPPQFGKVVVAVRIANVDGLPFSKMQQYSNYLKARCPLTIRIGFITPEFTYIRLISTVRYNINVTNESVQRINTIVTAAINSFNVQNLDDFNSTLRFSQLTTVIDQCDSSIISNNTKLSIYKKLVPSTTQYQNHVLNFALPLVDDLPTLPPIHPIANEKTVSSDTFTYEGKQTQIEDDGNGILRLVEVAGNQVSMITTIGLVDYTTGVVNINNFKVDSYAGNAINIYVLPKDNDVACRQNTIMTIEPAGINLTIEPLSQ